MSGEYTHQILRVVVAQICQTIGWHSIQSTPLELLVDILHKYLQELTRETYRYTELYGRTDPNLDDVGLAFRNLNINLHDIEEYTNYVDCVSCQIDVPKYPVHKESNLNFLKPGSKEVLTRPMHVHEYLPPIFPEKEVVSEAEHNDTENSCEAGTNSTHENGLFKKPDINESSVCKKPRFAFEEEGRPTREISSVMMTSSGFISPAREGKLPDSKSPILPETKPTRKSPSPAPNINTTIPLPVGNMENKFVKKIKKKSGLLTNGEKERKRDKSSNLSSSTSLTTKVMNGVNHHVKNPPGKPNKLLSKKQKNKEKKHKEHTNNILSERSIGNQAVGGENTKSKLDSALSKGEQFTQHLLPPPLNTNVVDTESKLKIDKLSSEPDKQKLNIFKKISSSKKDREDSSKSPNMYPDSQILSNIPEGTTITPAPPVPKSHSHSHSHSKAESEHVICIDDEPTSPISKIPPYMKVSPRQAALISQNLEALGTTATPTTTKSQTRKPRKRTNQQATEQALPLNLSNSHPINMVKSDILQNSKLPGSTSHKTPKGKKERKSKAKQKESKKELQQQQQHQNGVQDFPNTKNTINPLQSMFPNSSTQSKIDSILNQGSTYATPNFSAIPTIPMFPFYPFPPRPGLIPSTSLFSPLQQMPDNSSFKQYLPMMRFDFGHKGPRLGSKFDDEPSPTPPPLPPGEAEKGYCNVAPLVPDSMKFHLSPTRYLSPSSTSTTTTSQKKLSVGSTYDGFGGVSSTMPSHQSEQQQQSSLPGIRQKSPVKFSDIPIEISDDEKPKSDIDEKITSKALVGENLNDNKMSANNSYNNYPDYSSEVYKNEKDRQSSDLAVEREEKHEKRKDKEHKKGKKYKEGKIKKKKDKKDKSKSKDKTGKRKDKEEKKDKDKTKKLKKEKKKEKMRALIYSSDDGKQLNESGDCVAVPKLTLKLGISNSPQHSHSSDEKKLSQKNDRRESSPELARISPLVTRPPKQKNLNEFLNQVQYDDSCGGATSSSLIYSLQPPPSTQPQQSQHHHNQSRNFPLDTTQQQISSTISNHHQQKQTLNLSGSNSNYLSSTSINSAGDNSNQQTVTENRIYSASLSNARYTSSNLNVSSSSVTENASALSSINYSSMGRSNSNTTATVLNTNNYNIMSSTGESRSNQWIASKPNNFVSSTECNRPSSYIVSISVMNIGLKRRLIS